MCSNFLLNPALAMAGFEDVNWNAVHPWVFLKHMYCVNYSTSNLLIRYRICCISCSILQELPNRETFRWKWLLNWSLICLRHTASSECNLETFPLRYLGSVMFHVDYQQQLATCLLSAQKQNSQSQKLLQKGDDSYRSFLLLYVGTLCVWNIAV